MTDAFSQINRDEESDDEIQAAPMNDYDINKLLEELHMISADNNIVRCCFLAQEKYCYTTDILLALMAINLSIKCMAQEQLLIQYAYRDPIKGMST